MFSFLSIFKINLCFCSPSFSIWISCSKENEWTVPLGLGINNGLNKTKGSIAPLLQIGLYIYKYVIIAGDKQMFSFIWKTMFKKWMFIFYLYCSFWVIVVKMHVFIPNCPPCGRMTSDHLQRSRTVLQLVPLRLDWMLITSVASVSVDQQEER